jgi:CubicO group peptidase (beta-lactamase class C family)
MDQVWRLLDAQVESGRMPGYAAAIRLGGRTSIRTGGRMAVEADSAPVTKDTLFRIASLSKPIGAALALGMVRDGILTLDDPIARWLPEAASPRVLVTPDAPLDRTTEAVRPITVRHLLTMTCGWGVVLAPTPLRDAMLERGVFANVLPPQMSGDEFVARLTGLPLAFQPGEGWLYDSGMDLLGVLLARAAGKPLADLLAERVTGPLGMSSTGFGTSQVDRLATAYWPGENGLEVLDPPNGGFAGPPAFAKLAGGLVSTVDDVLRFFCAMADGGAPVLTRESVELMTTDALTEEQRRQATPITGPGGSWGLGTGVDAAAEPGSAPHWRAPGRWGWNGGSGTTAHVDPGRDTVAVLLTQRAMAGPQDGFDDFFTAVADLAPPDSVAPSGPARARG